MYISYVYCGLLCPGFHYFLRDICFLFLRWNDFDPSKSVIHRQYASRFVSFLMSRATDHGQSRLAIGSRLKANLTVIKLLTEQWKDALMIDKEVLITFLRSELDSKQMTGGQGKTDRSVGLQLLGMCIGLGFPVYTHEDSKFYTEEELMEVILTSVMHRRKDIHEPASMVCI